MLDAGTMTSVADAGVAAVVHAAQSAPVVQDQQAGQAGQAGLQFWLMGVLPLVVFFTVQLFRALPWSKEFAARQFVLCDVCLCFWSCVVLIPTCTWFFTVPWQWTLIHFAPAPGLALLLLAAVRRLEKF